MVTSKKQSNPFSTGGGGVHFEAHIQASYVALMLTGGYAPCLPCWPIKEIKLQGKIDGFDTDDLVVVVENENSKEQRKLLGQIKHSISVNQNDKIFGEVIKAAWDDFNNPCVFTKGKDVIALITGPVTKVDSEVAWLFNHARANPNDPQRFLRNVGTANFSSEVKRTKLKVICDHLKAANGNAALADRDLHEFFSHFYLLGYDLGEEEGVVLSLIKSHISQFKIESSVYAWDRILTFTMTRNHHAGCIKRENLPNDLTDLFIAKPTVQFPIQLALSNHHVEKMDWTKHPDATYLALAVLIGSWQDKSQCDLDAVAQVLGISYDDWLKKARELLHSPDSPLSLKNGVWKVVNRSELWSLLGSRILDQNLDTLRSLAITVLQESDPAFELPSEERYAASVHGKVLKCSSALRKGIAEGLAILGNDPQACENCSLGKADATTVLVVREVLADADWTLWGSLNGLLPTLAEAAPGEFLDVVGRALRLHPCPFDELFAQEGGGFTGGNYLTGLLWALEGLAWDEQYLVRACDALAELASHDPGGKWANRPSNSLATILLPWLPQTLAPVEKRKVAVQTILNDWPEIAWSLIIQLLPGQHQTSSGSHKPRWRKTIPDDWEKGVTQKEYLQQASFYAELAVKLAGHNSARLSALIEHFDSLPKPAFDQLLGNLASSQIIEIPEEQRLSIWDNLTKFTHKHRKYADAQWALPDEALTRIELVADRLAPTNPTNLYQHLFSGREYELYDDEGNWEEQSKKLNDRRKAAVQEIFQQNGVEGVIEFAESVSNSFYVGYALGDIDDEVFEHRLLPGFLDSIESKQKTLAGGFIWRRYSLKGWQWCDDIDKSDWSPEQVGLFLSCLPFTKEAWDRASQWLEANEREYWNRTDANAYQVEGDFAFAIEKLIKYGRPHAAIDCLGRMRHAQVQLDIDQCIQALLAAASSNEPSRSMDGYQIVELIKYLQTAPSVNSDDLFRVEWAFVSLLDGHRGATPKHLENKLATDPEFFCELIRLIYRSKKEDQPSVEATEGAQAIATNAWRLLKEWRTPPGTQQVGSFSGNLFTDWLQRVKEISKASGHLEVALINVGEVLIHSPADSDGLWMHRSIAAALNDRDADEMRNGYRTGVYNSRGAHWVDPTGKPEKELAKKFRDKAEDIENAGFARIAITLRNLADGYERDAERVISDHGGANEE